MILQTVVARKDTWNAQVIKQEPVLRLSIKRNPELMQHSKLLDCFRQCDRCPLGEKLKVIKQGKEEVMIRMPAVCGYYEKGKKECPIGKEHYINMLQEYYDIVDSIDYEKELSKLLIKNALSDASISRDVEIIEKGRPGFNTNVHEERAVKILDSLLKLRIGGDKHLHIHKENIAETLINNILNSHVKINIPPEQKILSNFTP